MSMLIRASARFPQHSDGESITWLKGVRIQVEELQQVTIQALEEARDAVCSMLHQIKGGKENRDQKHARGSSASNRYVWENRRYTLRSLDRHW